ncbi:uncharacterized protein EV422DRAFT_411261 [Fimicolochytrium jonesii]|uniref:uncharacterized protein n=1 Tax=Fimicolochytrium jonesii TaxID=1396493 RepID=UPI0022FED1FB|nr:uncharacterized protein EV422DRAFT_411261 [Fimicolochytrium jonesii]KAI8821973.1 hypothetical protein EV422DRAFT_411261 [Fimicolochytrium jonesii]
MPPDAPDSLPSVRWRPSLTRWWRRLIKSLTETYDIPPPPRIQRQKSEAPDRGASSSRQSVHSTSSEHSKYNEGLGKGGLHGQARSNGSLGETSGKAPIATREYGDEAYLAPDPTGRHLVDEEKGEDEDHFFDEEDFGDGFGDEDVGKFMHPISFQFKNPRAEEDFFRTHLLPNRIVHLRLLAALQLLQYGVILFPTYSGWLPPRANPPTEGLTPHRFGPAYITVWVVQALLWSFLLTACLWKRGKIYISLCLRSTTWRYVLTILEVFAVGLAASWDFFLSENPEDPVGPLSTVPICYYAISSGFAATYRQGVAGLLFVAIVCSTKFALVLAKDSDVYVPSVIYAVPLLVTIIISRGLILDGDKQRRISYIKYRVVEERLAQMRVERMKTDYLLSLSLPKTIVTTLREVGATNFDLIATRIPDATVMFGDLKNFKEVASTLGSTKEALTLLNGIFQYMDEAIEEYSDLTKIKTISTKILFVGGLGGSTTHTVQVRLITFN